MKATIGCILTVVCALAMMTLVSCQYVHQGEKAFVYDVSSGKKVNPTDNPLLPMGFNATFGINKRFFMVLGTIMDYEFTATTNSGSSPFDEMIRWDSAEGVIMAAEYKIYGRVTDPWEFFVHFGETEYDYKIKAHKDVRVYEALRQAGRVMDQKQNELAGKMNAEDIRTHPDKLKQELLAYIKGYMQKFGFEVTDVMFMGNFQYPDGNVIVEARQQLTSLDSEIRNMQQMLNNRSNQVRIDTSMAKRDADVRIAEARRRASAIEAESGALAAALRQSIDQIGIQGTMSLKMAELYGELTKAGAVPVVVVDEKSIFATPFYPTRVGGPNRTNSVTQIPVPSLR